MDALMPRTRCDKGSVRRLSDECALEIHRLKEKFPKLDAAQIHARLVADAFIPATVSVRTIQRFIKNKGLRTCIQEIQEKADIIRETKKREREKYGLPK
jgi:hypothetical protein